MNVKRIFINAALFLTLTVPLYAQDAEEVQKRTRETDILNRPQDLKQKFLRVPETPPKPEVEERKPRAPERKVFIKEIKIIGIETLSPEKFDSLIAPYKNKEVTITDLEELAQEIQKEYLREGIIAAVFVPEQQIAEETVNLQVVEARMGELIIQDHKYFTDKNLRYYWRIPQGEIMRYNEISKGLQLMSKNPDRKVRADLKAGKKPGTTDVILTAETRLPAHVVATYDNEGAESTGRNRTAGGIRHNNLLGLDDTFLTEYVFGRDFDGFFAYHSLPITHSGTSFLYGYSRVNSRPEETEPNFGIRSEAHNTSVSLHQDIFKEDLYWGEIFCGFDAKDKTISLYDTGTFNKDNLRIFSLGSNLILRKSASYTTWMGAVYQGVDAFGATPNDYPLASRNARSEFTKFYMDARHRRVLWSVLQINLRLAGQIASTKLTPQEEFSLGGNDSIRGYPSGDFLADNAFMQSLEFIFPSFFIPPQWGLFREPLRDTLTWTIFADHGWGTRRGASPTEKQSVDFIGVGIGVNLNIAGNSFLRCEWGVPVGDETITEAGRSRVHFSAIVQF